LDVERRYQASRLRTVSARKLPGAWRRRDAVAQGLLAHLGRPGLRESDEETLVAVSPLITGAGLPLSDAL